MSGGLVVLDVVGLTPDLIGEETPHLARMAREGSSRPLECPFPAVTLTSQAGILTGKTPAEHGIVANGWWWPELAEVLFWRQPHALLDAEDLPTRLRRERPGFRVLKSFWWFNMYAPVDYAVTPRPMYPADGRKIPDIHTHPAGLRDELQSRHGPFPLFKFWGPLADRSSSDWITSASLELIEERRPELSLVYIPHLDYDFQRHGPDHTASRQALREVDEMVGRFLEQAERLDLELVILSEYGITPVSRPVHPNRALRAAGWLRTREELGLERLDAGASDAFAVADHQIAHVYVKDRALLPEVRACLAALPGVETVLEGESLRAEGLDHRRSGDLVLVSAPDSWFTYYYWDDDRVAPDYARTVDIHRKPGYDPAELHFDPNLSNPKLKAGRRLIQKKLGFRTLLDVIGLDASVVRGSHGRRPARPGEGPILMTRSKQAALDAHEVFPLAEVPGFLADLAPEAGSRD